MFTLCKHALYLLLYKNREENMSFGFYSIQKSVLVKDKLKEFIVKPKINVLCFMLISFLSLQVAFGSDGNKIEEERLDSRRPQVHVDLHLGPHIHRGPGLLPHLHLNPHLHIHVTLPKDEEKLDSLDPNKVPFQTIPAQEIPHLGAGPTPTITSRVNYLLKYQLGGWGSAVRNGYSSYQTVSFSGNIGGERPLTRLEGNKWMNNVFDSLKSTGIFNEWRADQSLLIVAHEFAPNGVSYDTLTDNLRSTQKWEYSAKYPLTVETYIGIREAASQWLKDKPKGVGIIIGGCAIDTGKKITDDFGRELTIGENRGFAVFSGDSEVLEFSKRYRDKVDGWTEAYAVPQQGKGYTEIPADKLVSGWNDSIAISICKDAARIEAFPMKAGLIVITGAGVPSADTIAASNLASAKLLVDITQFDDTLDKQPYLSDRTGLYEYTNRKEFIQLFSSGLSFLSMSPNQMQESLASYQKVDQARFVFPGDFNEKGTILITKPREIPTVMGENRFTQAEKSMVEQQSPIAHQKNDPPKEASIADPVGESFKDQFEANKDHVDRALEDFGGKREEK